MQKLKLERDLRRQILRGHPWVYRQALKAVEMQEGAFCQLLDNRGQALAWGYSSQDSPLAFRVLSLADKPPPREEFLHRISRAWDLRSSLRQDGTTGYRLVNGEGDGLPGMVVDIYGSVGVVQFDGEAAKLYWQSRELWSDLLQITSLKSLYFKPRRSDETLQGVLMGEPCDLKALSILEKGVHWQVNVEEGQKTGFFFDQRENRAYVRQFALSKSCLNLYSYTGGFSVACGLGGAAEVTSVDLSAPAIAMTETNWRINSLQPAKHQGVSQDVKAFLASTDKTWDLILVDPPSMAPSEKTKAKALVAYQEIFALAASRLQKGGDLFLSSCSSHISYEDFFLLVTESLGQVRRRGQVLFVGGQGLDHPYPLACPELRYLKFVHLRIDK